MENSLQQLNEYLEKIGRSEFVTEEMHDTKECNNSSEYAAPCGVLEKSTDLNAIKEKSNPEHCKTLSQCKTNEKSATSTRDFTPNLHNSNNSFADSVDLSTNEDQVLVEDEAPGVHDIPGSNFIDSVKAESLHFEESEEAVNELAEIGLNTQSLQNLVTSGPLKSSTKNIDRKTDGQVHPVALKKSTILSKNPEPTVQPQLKGQVTTLMDISSITELKRLWVKKDNVYKRVNASSSKQINSKTCDLPVPVKTYKTMRRHRPLANGNFKKNIINIETNTKQSSRLKSEESRCKRNRIVNESEDNYETKECSVRLVRVENLPNQGNLKFDLFCPQKCIAVKLENPSPENLEEKSLIKNTEQKKQILEKIRAIANTQKKNLKRKTKTMRPKQTLGTMENNAKKADKTSAFEKAVKEICNKRLIVRMENIKITKRFEEVGSLPEKSEEMDGDPCVVIKTETDEIYYDDDNDDDNYIDDYSPSDDDKDDDYHPRKKLKKSKSKSRPTSLVKHSISVKPECDELGTDGKNHIKSKKVKGTRIGRPPVFGHFECKLCDFNAIEKNLVTKHHFKTHRQTFKCEPCSKIFKSVNGILEHNAYNHDGGKPFKCDHDGCLYASKNPTDLSRHKAKHETELRHVCSICGWRTKWPRNMRHHHVMKHCDDRNYQCTICDFAAKRKQDLKHHLYRHTDTKPIQCLTCGFRVKTNFELRSHMLVHSNEKPFECTFPGCTSRTKTKSDLTKHMRIHLTERNFKCHICSKAYKDQVALNKHIRGIHVDDKKFKCDICGKMFKNRYALKKHVFLHSGFKPYDCAVCGWKFSNRNNLQKHMVTHDTKERPYLCPLCPYAAKVTDHLLAHIGSFHSDKYAYFCELCSKPFKRYTQLNLHYERMHSKEEIEKLKESGNADLALLKMETELEVEENETVSNRKRKRDKKIYKAVCEPDVKTEPLDEEYGDTIGNITEDFDDVRLNENTGVIEMVKKKKLNTIVSDEREVNCEDNIRADVKNLGVDTETEKTDIVGNEVTEINDKVMETDRRNGQNQDNESDFDEQKLSENIVITKDERRTVAFCNNIRLPLATKGFRFNYDKTGKKPAKSWFMDTSVMDKEAAERHKKYNRRVGLLPPLPKGHPPKGYKKLKKIVGKRKKNQTEKIETEKCTKDNKIAVRRNATRSTRFSNKYTELEMIEDELSAQDNESLPKFLPKNVDSVKVIPEESHHTITESSYKELNSTNEMKDIFLDKKGANGKSKEELSSVMGMQISKNGREPGKSLNVRKPLFLESNTAVTEVHESSVTGESALSDYGQNNFLSSLSTESGNKETEIIENGVNAQHKDTMSIAATEVEQDPKNGRNPKKSKCNFLKQTVQLRLKYFLQWKDKLKNLSGKKDKLESMSSETVKLKNVPCKTDKLKNVPCKTDKLKNVSRKETFTKNGECNLDTNASKLNERTDESSVYMSNKTLHIPVKDTQLVMVYPTTISQNTGMGVISSVIEGRTFTTSDHASHSERVDIKQDLDDTLEESSDIDTNGDKGLNSDKSIMQLEYSAFVKEEPDFGC